MPTRTSSSRTSKKSSSKGTPSASTTSIPTNEVTPICPNCQILMIKKSGQYGEFWGCPNHPNCKQTVSIKRKKVIVESTFDMATVTAIKLSPEQDAAVNAAVNHEDADVVIAALAGVGKTFTLVRIILAKMINWKKAKKPKRVLAISFSRNSRDDLVAKMPPSDEYTRIDVYTWNGLGGAALKRYMTKIKFEKQKSWDILNGYWPEIKHPGMSEEEMSELRRVRAKKSVAVRMMGLLKSNLIHTPTTDDIESLAQLNQIDLPGEEDYNEFMFVVQKAMYDSLMQCYEGIIDYDDQLFFPAYIYTRNGFNIFESYDLVCSDESQDLNICQQIMAKLLTERNGSKRVGQLIIVGDENQGIYGFRGADWRSMDTFKSMLLNAGRRIIELPLTETRRCYRAIAEEAALLVPSFRTARSEDGEVSVVDGIDYETLAPGTAFIATKNNTLIREAYRLVAKRITFYIVGKDFEKRLQDMVAGFKAKTMDELYAALDNYHQSQLRKLDAKKGDQTDAIERLNDEVSSLREIAGHCNTIAEVAQQITFLFAEHTKAKVVLMTGHKSKGLEYDVVYFLKANEEPGARALKNVEQLRQRRNLLYVIITRAIKRLLFVGGKPNYAAFNAINIAMNGETADA